MEATQKQGICKKCGANAVLLTGEWFPERQASLCFQHCLHCNHTWLLASTRSKDIPSFLRDVFQFLKENIEVEGLGFVRLSECRLRIGAVDKETGELS